MPHKCTNCGTVHPDGTDSILNGCTSCGGNKFRFVNETDDKEPNSIIKEAETTNTTDSTDTTEETSAPFSPEEANAQRQARSAMVDTSELTNNANPEPTNEDEDGPVSIESVKEALNQQFESIRVLSPGEYELDLMKLYEREDHIISLHRDGKYAIHINESNESENV